MKDKFKRVWPWYLLAVVLAIADQLVKLWVRSAMALGETRPFIPHFIELYHLRNTGAAFSMLSSHFSRLCVTLVLAGAAGNLIDRAAFGAVTDMFNFTFIRFGVFNVADVWVVGGVIGYCIYLIVMQVKESKSAKTSGEGPNDEAGH